MILAKKNNLEDIVNSVKSIAGLEFVSSMYSNGVIEMTIVHDCKAFSITIASLNDESNIIKECIRTNQQKG